MKVYKTCIQDWGEIKTLFNHKVFWLRWLIPMCTHNPVSDHTHTYTHTRMHTHHTHTHTHISALNAEHGPKSCMDWTRWSSRCILGFLSRVDIIGNIFYSSQICCHWIDRWTEIFLQYAIWNACVNIQVMSLIHNDVKIHTLDKLSNTFLSLVLKYGLKTKTAIWAHPLKSLPTNNLK